MQGILDLDNKYQDNADDFIVSHSNFEAYNAILSYEKWQNKRLLIIGSPKSGKTSLVKIWQKKTDAVFFDNMENVENIKYNKNIIIDNIENFSESSLINIVNFANERSLSLLLTSIKYPSFSLKDLNSRIKGTYKVLINEPDENLLKLLIVKLLKRKQVKVSKETVDFIFSNMERSYEFIYKIVNLIDKFSKIAKRKITIPFIKKVAAQYIKSQYSID